MNKYKKLMGNTLIFGIGQLMSKLIGFFMAMLYTGALTEAEYNTMDLIYGAVNVLYPIVTMSMADALIRFGMAKEYDLRRLYSTACGATLGGMAVFALLTPAVTRIPDIGAYCLLLYIHLYFSSFRQLTAQFIRARGYVKLFALDGMLSTFTQLALNIVFMKGFGMGVRGYILSLICSDALSLVFLAFVADLPRFLDTRFFDTRLLKEMLRFSAPLIPTYLLWWITSMSDRWFVKGMTGGVEAGIYSFGNKLPTLLLLVTTMFYQAWQMSSIEERDSRTLGKFYENVFGAYSSLLFIAAAGLIMLSKPLTMLLDHGGPDKRYGEAFMFTPILIMSMVFQCFCQFLSSVYTTKKKSKNSCNTAFIAAFVNIILNFRLIPRYGVWGAAIATAVSYFACFAVRIIDTRRYIFFRVDYRRLLVNILITAVMCVIAGKHGSLYGLWLVIAFIVSLVYNFGAIIKTLRRILAPPKKRAAGRG